MTSRMDNTQWIIVDNQTLDGVWVNGRRIPPSEDFPIQVGDSVEISVPWNGNDPECNNGLAQQQQPNISLSVTRQTAGSRNNLKRERTTEDDEPSTSQPKRPRCSFVDRPCPLTVKRQRLIRHLKQKVQELEQQDGDQNNVLAQQQQANILLSVTRQTAGSRNNLKRERTTEDDEPSTSQPKRPRCSFVDRPCPLPVRRRRLMRHLKQKLQELEQQDDDQSHRVGNDTPNLLQMFSQDIAMLKQQVALLEGRHSVQGLHAADQVAEENEFLQMVHTRIEELEESLNKRKELLEEQKRKQREQILKHQLRDALQEQIKMMQGIMDYQQRLEDVLLAKNQELKKQKEEAKVQIDHIVTQVTEVLEDELQCVFCMDFLIETRVLNCGHSFCRQCIDQWRGLSNDCPVCRTAIRSLTPCRAMDNCIDSMLEKLSPDVKARRQEVINERNAIRDFIDMDQ